MKQDQKKRLSEEPCVKELPGRPRAAEQAGRELEERQKAALEDALQMARAANEARSSFLSRMSHDLRTPLNAIIGFLTLMREEADHPEMIREYIERIDTASHHLLGLINDMLDMSRLESGSTVLCMDKVDLARVITETDTVIRPQARAKNQTFEIFASRLQHEHLTGDGARINQILINLLSNAVKYTPENGAIELQVEELPQVLRQYSRIRFTVRDNGMGMDKDYLKVIFDPFTREDKKVLQGMQGIGLGMAITKSLVDLMGGTIQVDSKLGEGSTFVVELELRIREQGDGPGSRSERRIARRIAADDGGEGCQNIVGSMAGVGVSTDAANEGSAVRIRMGRAEEAGRHGADVVRGMRILVVDDIEVNRLIMDKILGTLGAECDTACDGREAVEKFMASPAGYDLILMDVQMPEMDGYRATRMIRASGHPRAASIPIIAMTANAFVDDVRDAINAGMDAHLAKPVQVDKLKATIRQVLAGRAAAKK